jgi:hypothetical protein
MSPFSDVKYVYDPETLTTMGAAFDAVCQAVPPDLKDHEGARRRLALLILRPWIEQSVMQHALAT